MKKHYYILFSFFILVLFFYSYKAEAILPLYNKTIIIDPGHGDIDVGCNYNNIYEKDINLKVSLFLKDYLESYGANIIMTRDGDYDLSNPNHNYRKKSDFDNRIRLINSSNANLYLSIHTNYLNNINYFGPQVFYDKDNKEIAVTIQRSMNKILNNKRNVKKIPSDTYMYKKLKINGVLVECGFLSNNKERILLNNSDYQKKIALSITNGILEYYSK